jgi:hypothetical protein
MALAGSLLATGPVAASAILTVTSGAQTTTVTDPDSNATLTTTVFTPFDVWNITATGHNNSAFFGFPFLDLSVSGGTSGSGAALTVSYTVDGFDLGAVLDQLFHGQMTANPANSGFTFGFCVGGTCINPPVAGDPSGITMADLLADVSGPFSITLFETLNPRGQTSYSNDLTVQLVPEPGTLLLLGVAVLAIVLVRQRNR